MEQFPIILWAVPAIFLLLAATFRKVGVMVPAHPSPRPAIVGCLAGMVAITCEALPLRQIEICALLGEPAKWIAMLGLIRAFRLRHEPDLPLRPALLWFAACSGAYFLSSAVLPDPLVRTAVLMIAPLGCLAFALPLLRYHDGESDHFAKILIAVIALPMLYRRASFLMSGNPFAFGEREWSADIQISYLFSIAIAVTIALALLIAIGRDTIMDREEASTIDPLTGIANRRAFIEWVDGDAPDTPRYGAALMVDLDHFKQINDQHGHEAGDAVLEAVARIIRDRIGNRGNIARIGGEEFAILLHAANVGAAEPLAADLRQRIEALRVSPPLECVQVTASVGVAQRREGDTLRETLRAADQALYRAKGTGRNRVCVASDCDAANDLGFSSLVAG